MAHTIFIEDAQDERKVGSTMKTALRKTVRKALERMNIGFPCEVSIRLVSKDEIRELNSEFRDVDEVTDVLSFPSGDYDEEIIAKLRKNAKLFLGDIALCPDRIYTQASDAKHSPTKEATVLVAHSVLHLLGYDHYEKEEKEIMFALQEEISESVMNG